MISLAWASGAPYANLYADARWPNGFVDNKTGTQVNAENYWRTK
jgi:hypothetical protein